MMKDTPLEKDELSAVNDADELDSPHFDELAVAVAQPVQPLASPVRAPNRLALLLRSPLVSFALILTIVCVGILTTGAVVGRVLFPGSTFEATEKQNADAQPVAEPAQAASSSSEAEPAAHEATTLQKFADTLQNSDRPRSRSERSVRRIRPRLIVIGEEGRPAARKVGEIRYGRP